MASPLGQWVAPQSVGGGEGGTEGQAPFGHRWPVPPFFGQWGRPLSPVCGVGGQYPFGQWVAIQSVGWAKGSPKGSRCARAPVAIQQLHAKTPPRPLGHRSRKSGSAGVASGWA